MSNYSGLLPLNFKQDDINKINPEDKLGEDGLYRCGRCGGKKQYRIVLGTFQKVVPCLCKCKQEENEKIKKENEYKERMIEINRLKDASMMASKYKTASFSYYKDRPENRKAHKIALNYVEKFGEMKASNQGLIFYGPVGTGKSYTSACIANALMYKNIPVIMTSFVKILQDIQGNSNEADYIQILNSASLLIIDDLGTERSTDYALEKVYNVIDSRTRANKPMILTTNLTLEEMLYKADIRYKRVYDRIFETCYPVEISGTSFREQEAAERFGRMKGLLEQS